MLPAAETKSRRLLSQDILDAETLSSPKVFDLSILEERIERLISPVVAATGFDLVRVRLTGSKNKILQIMAERADKTMTAEDCAVLSRALSPVLEENDPIEGTYDLEVSSPGIDRPLTRLSDFHDWQGYSAKLELDRLVEGRKRFRGVLAGVEGDNVCLDVEGEEETALIPFQWVASAKLELTDELIKDTLTAAKAAQKEAAEAAGSSHQPPNEAGDEKMTKSENVQ